MLKKIKLDIESTIADLDECGMPDGEPQISRTSHPGVMRIAEDEISLSYRESSENGCVSCAITVRGGLVSVRREGAIASVMLFDPEESIDFNGNTGPFIQYTYARIRSILRKAAEQGIAIPETLPTGTELSEKEISLIQHLNGFTATLRQAGADYNPASIANYCYELVKEYNQFYHDFSVLREENADKQAVRLALSSAVAKVVKNGMSLLGIEVPERM